MRHIKLFEAFDEFDEGIDDKMAWTKYFDILSIKYSVGGDDYRLITPDHPEFDDCVQDCVENEFHKDPIEIYSVRRKEDGEIFTLGQPIYNVSHNIKSFGIAYKFWPSFFQMRVDIGNGGFPLNHKFFMSSTIVDLKKKGINKYYAMDINESKKIDMGDWLDLIKKYPSTTPNKYEFDKFKSLSDQYNVTCQFDEKNMANTRSISIMTPEKHIIIWKLEDEYWTVYTTQPRLESHYMCDGFDETLELVKNILKDNEISEII
jgi:hypothetical protein